MWDLGVEGGDGELVNNRTTAHKRVWFIAESGAVHHVSVPVTLVRTDANQAPPKS